MVRDNAHLFVFIRSVRARPHAVSLSVTSVIVSQLWTLHANYNAQQTRHMRHANVNIVKVGGGRDSLAPPPHFLLANKKASKEVNSDGRRSDGLNERMNNRCRRTTWPSVWLCRRSITQTKNPNESWRRSDRQKGEAGRRETHWGGAATLKEKRS